MNSIIERIKQAYRFNTDAEVADFLGIKASTLSMQKKRGKLDIIRILEKCSDLNKHWLLEGEGPMWREKVQQQRVSGIPIYSSISFSEYGKPNLEESKKVSRIIADGEGPEYLKKYPEQNLMGYVVSVDSMEPTIKKDDITIIDTGNKNPNDGTIFLVAFNHTVGCRRIQKKPDNRFALSCDNRFYESFEIQSDSKEFNLIGKVVWIIRNMQ